LLKRRRRRRREGGGGGGGEEMGKDFLFVLRICAALSRHYIYIGDRGW